MIPHDHNCFSSSGLAPTVDQLASGDHSIYSSSLVDRFERKYLHLATKNLTETKTLREHLVEFFPMKCRPPFHLLKCAISSSQQSHRHVGGAKPDQRHNETKLKSPN